MSSLSVAGKRLLEKLALNVSIKDVWEEGSSNNKITVGKEGNVRTQTDEE